MSLAQAPALSDADLLRLETLLDGLPSPLQPMDEVDAPKIKVGMAVRISLDALPKQSFAGTVKRVAPYVFALEGASAWWWQWGTRDTDLCQKISLGCQR